MEHNWHILIRGSAPHGLDWLYGSESSPLDPTHLNRLAHLSGYLEPEDDSSFSYAVLNLSRHDTKHRPGLGAIAVVVSVRILRGRDHADRRFPKLVFAATCRDAAIDESALTDVSRKLLVGLLAADGTDRVIDRWYDEYNRGNADDNVWAHEHWSAFEQTFGLGRLDSGRPDLRWTCLDDAADNELVELPHALAGGALSDAVVNIAARACSVLHSSDRKWAAVASGRITQLPGDGLTLRLHNRISSRTEGSRVLELGSTVRQSDVELARNVLGLRPVAPATTRFEDVALIPESGAPVFSTGDNIGPRRPTETAEGHTAPESVRPETQVSTPPFIAAPTNLDSTTAGPPAPIGRIDDLARRLAALDDRVTELEGGRLRSGGGVLVQILVAALVAVAVCYTVLHLR